MSRPNPLALSVLLLAMVFLVACSAAPAAPSAEIVQTAIAATLEANPTSTPALPTATPTAEPCNVQSATFITEVEALFDDWSDTYLLADRTARVSLAPVVADLQDIRRQVTDLEAPDCAQIAKDKLVLSMDTGINGFLEFMANRENAAGELIVRYLEYVNDFSITFVALKEGEDLSLLPTPTPPLVMVGDGDNLARARVPLLLRVAPSGGGTSVEVRAEPDGARLDCRLEAGTEVMAVEVSLDRDSLRIEGSECDGWVRTSRLERVD